MIPISYITGWRHTVPWQTDEQVEQDLVICRSLVQIFSDDYLSSSLAFRGGTAIYKLYLKSLSRYSEDIDLVQLEPGPIGNIIDKIKEKLDFLGIPRVISTSRSTKIIFKFETEIPPIQQLKLKLEINCREHYNVFDIIKLPFEVNSDWFSGSSLITTYKIEELLATKIRALYQRNKGRDLYDIYKILNSFPHLDKNDIVKCYKKYFELSGDPLPDKNEFLSNIHSKMHDHDFLGDIVALKIPTEEYEPEEAYKVLIKEIINKM
jgi:predicted nucleotidyltransferase component of viral defense system